MKSMSLAGKIALVTGASSGIGAHLARTLAEQGCRVAIAARRTDKLKTLQNALTSDGLKAFAVRMDVADRASVHSALDAIENKFGTVEVLVNNAGVAGVHGFLEAPSGETDKVFAVNQKAVWDVAQAASRRLVKASLSGSIINISSITGLRAVGGASSYAVSKAAVAHMTRIQALEMARYNIRVNAIAPGYFPTELTDAFLNSAAGEKLLKRIPMKRIGRLEELDGPLTLLASDAGSFMTGTVIPVDGGHLLSSL